MEKEGHGKSELFSCLGYDMQTKEEGEFRYY
jgi:hypothetical protein